MPHVSAPEGVPGIVGLFEFSPETAKPLCDLAEILLRGPSSLSPGERELIAAYVSNLNQCKFCTASHTGIAAAQLSQGEALVEAVKKDFRSAPISAKLKALIEIAGKVQGDARRVSKQDIENAKRDGASEKEIHSAVLIAAAFCMYNRYVDGLAAWTPDDPRAYREMGERIARQGYLR
jgi:uncharacterized peroxidase-related enzyme